MFNKIKYCLIGFLLGNIFLIRAQTEIRGSVKDTLGNGIPLINVFINIKNNVNIIEYTYTDDNGDYTIGIKKKGIFILNFNGMSYRAEKLLFEIDSINPQAIITKNIILKEETFALDEVIINTERAIIVKNDTISIKVSEFINGNEEVVEDVLKKLPGIEVSEDGSIKVQGKTIEKIMVEGDDLFDKGYKLLTKNLNADVINKVEILEHFSDNPILKGIEDSDKVALNITLKEDKKTSLFGNASLGYGTEQFYESKLNLISFNKKTKYYFFGNLNNIGSDPTGDIYQLIYPNLFSGSSYIGDGEFANKFININSNFININKKRTNFNNAELASFNGVYNPNDKLKLKGLAFFTSDETNFFRNNIQQYIIDSNSFTNTEAYKLREKKATGFVKLEAIYSSTENSRIEYTGKFNLLNERVTSNLFFNNEQLNESLNGDSKFIDQRITYTKKLTDKKAIQITSRYIYDEKPQQYNINAFLYEDLFPDQSNSDAITQNIDNETSFFGLETNYFINNKKNNFDLKGGFSKRDDNLQSSLFFINGNEIIANNDLAYKNDLNYNFSDLYSKIKYKLTLRKVHVKAGIEIHQLFTSLKTNNRSSKKENPFYSIPNLGLSWRINKKNNFNTFYKINTRNTTLEDVYNGFILKGYRNFKKGIGRFEQFTGNILLANYTYGNWSSAFLVNVSLLYQKDNDYKSSNRDIVPNYNKSQTIILKNKEFSSLNASLDGFIDIISSNLKIATSASKSEIQNVINNSNLRTINSINYSFGGELRSALDGKFNFHLGSKWITSIVETIRKNTNIDNTSFLDLDYKISNKINLQIKNEYYHFGSLNRDNNFFFSDININYTLKENKLKLKLNVNNIFNTNNFANYYISDVNISSTTYRLLPRYLLLKFDFKF